jgi:hypothetical protein
LKFKFTRYQRVMLTDYCRYFVFGFAVFSAVLVVATLAEIFEGDIYWASYVAGLILRVVPASLLVAALFTIGIRKRNGEIVALYFAGYSLSQITWPLLVPATFSFILLFLLHQLHSFAEAGGGGIYPGDESARVYLSVAHSMICFIAILVGIVAAAGVGPGELSSRFLVSSIIIVVYYLFDALIRALEIRCGYPDLARTMWTRG